MTDVENLRYEAGKEARTKGEDLHEGASEEFERGYSRVSGFGSNVSPRKFGKDIRRAGTWKCVCGHTNKDNRVYMRSGNICCWNCGTEKAFGIDD